MNLRGFVKPDLRRISASSRPFAEPGLQASDGKTQGFRRRRAPLEQRARAIAPNSQDR